MCVCETKTSRDAKQFLRRQGGEIAQVKQQGTALEPEIEIKARIAERTVHEGGAEDRAHGDGVRQ